MDILRNKAKELLKNHSVELVIGYENGTNGKVRASFVNNPENTDSLIYDERCIQNLAVYLIKKEVYKQGKLAIVANTSCMRAIMMLVSEQQVKEENIIVLGISDDGNFLDFSGFDEIENYLSKTKINLTEKDRLALENLNKMTLEERQEFWKKELAKCFKCFACRAACPLCYCTRCTVECNQPQWIPVPSHLKGNLAWHMMRTMHLAGRCVGCGDCGRACPLDIPVHLLTINMMEEIDKMFGVKPGESRKMPSVLSTFKPDDKENFIL